MPEHEDGPLAAPLAWLNWQVASDSSSLCAPDALEVPIIVLDADGVACVSSQPGVWQWLGQPPRVVTIQWSIAEQLHNAVIPVLDETGRLAATAMPELDLDEVWWQLANFPQSAVDEDKTLDELEESPSSMTLTGATAVDAGVSGYPIRRMMSLIEQIASKQVDLHQLDWFAWCTRLEQSLLQVAKDPVINVFRAMGINPLSPLRDAAFLPVYAEPTSSLERANYLALLSRIETSWDVAHLCNFGDLQ